MEETQAQATIGRSRTSGTSIYKAHTKFRHLWKQNREPTEILSQATDETSYIQPTLKQLVDARGKDMGGFNLNPVTSWIIQRDGKVLFRSEKWK